MGAAEEFREIGGHFTRLVEGVPDAAAWDRSAPVPGWTARDVPGHLIGWLPPFLASGADVVLPVGPSVDDDPVAAWRVFAEGVQALLDDPATAGRTLTNEHIGTMPLPVAISQIFIGDVFLHSWDLARATGQDETLDPERCAMMLAGMQPLDEMLRASGQYGPKVDVPDDADAQTKLLGFIGRNPLAQP